jgi:hypothetical protein
MHCLTGVVILLPFRLGNKDLLVLITIIFCSNLITDLYRDCGYHLSSAKKGFFHLQYAISAPRLKQDDEKLAAIF